MNIVRRIKLLSTSTCNWLTLFIYLLVDWLVGWLVDWLIDWLTILIQWLTLLIDWLYWVTLLINWLYWLIDWLYWLINCWLYSLIDFIDWVTLLIDWLNWLSVIGRKILEKIDFEKSRKNGQKVKGLTLSFWRFWTNSDCQKVKVNPFTLFWGAFF